MLPKILRTTILLLLGIFIGSGSIFSQETARFTSSGQFAVGTTNPENDALVDLTSTTRGLLIPRLTTIQRDAISTPPEGLLIYNTTLDKFDYYTGGAWKTVLSTTSSSSSSAEGAGFCSEGVSDYDGNYYRTVKIGNKCWMAENLKSMQYSDGTAITGDYAYNNELHNIRAFGRLYTWAAVMNGAPSSNTNPSGVQGVCPTGWHVPSEDEWKVLEFTLGMSETEYNTGGYRGSHYEGAKLKETSDAHLWDTGTGSCPGNNLTGFSALPGGERNGSDETYGWIYLSAYFWSCTEDADFPDHAYPRYLHYSACDIGHNVMDKDYAYSVRCVRD